MAETRRRLELAVPGLHCASCVDKVEKSLAGLRGVGEVSVDLATRSVRIEAGPAVDAEAVVRVLRDLGYAASVPGSPAEALEAAGLRREAEERVLFARFGLGVVLGIPLMAAGPLGLSSYTSLLLAIPLQVWGGWHFHRGLARSVWRRSPDMDTLVSLSTWAAFSHSAFVTLVPEVLPTALRTPQWDAVAGLVTLVTLGRWLESRARGRVSEAVARLMRMSPKTVRVLRDGAEEVLPVERVAVGEIIRVRPGEQIGMDGVVLSGTSTVSEALLTGESLPVDKAPGSKVWGGTLNALGSLEIRVERPGSDSALARIVAAVRASLAAKPRIQRLVDRVSAVFVPAVIIVAVSSALIWAVRGSGDGRLALALNALVCVLVVACPCALGLATPLALMAGIGRLAQAGIFVRNADAIERAARVDTVVLDKTGTLTTGRPSVAGTIAADGGDKRLLQLALAAAANSEHPLAEAIAAYARGKGIVAPQVEAFEAVPGMGMRARVNGRLVRVGSLAWLASEIGPTPQWLENYLTGFAGSVAGVTEEDAWLGALGCEDALRPGAREAVASLRAMGLEVLLVSGDRRAAAESAAREAGITAVHAEVLPEEKAQIIAHLRGQGRRVAMVGEGFNDAPALGGADVGVALASGTDVAIEAADLTLMRPDLGALAEAFSLSRRVRVVVRENLFWAFIYNIVLIPVAAGALYPQFGILLRPHHAGTAMALSSLSVALNSLRLRSGRSQAPAGGRL